MSRKDVIKALKAKEREVPYVWDGLNEDERPATAEELAQHQSLLDGLDKEAKGACLWRKLAETAGQ